MRTSFFAAAALLAVSAFAQAHEYNAGQLHIEHPWALALPPTSPNGAAYFVVQNRFAPGGYHLMLMGLKQPLVAGERFPLTLHFRKAGDVPVEIVVESKAPAEQGGHEQHGH